MTIRMNTPAPRPPASRDLQKPDALGPDPLGIAGLLSTQREQFLRFVAKRVGSVEVAEDVLHAAYLKALLHVASVRDEESASAWFYGILRNAITDHFRRRGVESAAEERERALASVERSIDPELHDAVCRCVNLLVQRLAPRDVELLTRVEIDGERLSVVAHEAGISAGNASVRLHRARAALRKGLVDCCGGGGVERCLDCSCEAPADEPDERA